MTNIHLVSALQADVYDVGYQVFQEDMRARATFPSYTTLEGAYLKPAFKATMDGASLQWTSVSIGSAWVDVAFSTTAIGAHAVVEDLTDLGKPTETRRLSPQLFDNKPS